MQLRGLIWWIDRWRKSSAFMQMTLEEQGAYRNLLDEAHLRGGALPADDRILAKACGDATRWRVVRRNVLARFVKRRDGWHNETLDLVLQQSLRRAQNQARYYAKRKHNNNGDGSLKRSLKRSLKATNKADSQDQDQDLDLDPSKDS